MKGRLQGFRLLSLCLPHLPPRVRDRVCIARVSSQDLLGIITRRIDVPSHRGSYTVFHGENTSREVFWVSAVGMFFLNEWIQRTPVGDNRL